MTDEADIRQEDVWDEHLQQLNVAAHWMYVVGVLGGGFIAMVGLIALLGAGGGG